MANDIAKMQETGLKRFLDTLKRQDDNWRNAVTFFDDDVQDLKLSSLITAGLYSAAGAGDLTATDLDSVAVTVSQSDFEVKHFVRWQELRKMGGPAYVARIAEAMAVNGAAHIEQLVSTGLLGLFAMAHPVAGDRAYGAGAKFIDAGLPFNLGAGTQSNLNTAALSPSTFATNHTMLRKYKNQAGVTANLGGNGRYRLIHGADNRVIAHEIANSDVSSAANQSNAFKGAATVEIVDLATKWFVVDTEANPCFLWLSQAPQVLISEKDDKTGVNIVGMFSATFGTLALEAGIIGSNS